MVEGDLVFYQRRLNEELARAQAAPAPSLRTLHYRWASEYRDRLDTLDPGSAAARKVPRNRTADFGDWLAEIA